jgi:hypothetical protein
LARAINPNASVRYKIKNNPIATKGISFEIIVHAVVECSKPLLNKDKSLASEIEIEVLDFFSIKSPFKRTKVQKQLSLFENRRNQTN